MKFERELMRGAGPVAVMTLLERDEMSGSEVVRALGEPAAGVLTMGQSSLYPMLYNLEAYGLVKVRWEEAAGGLRRRRAYRLTAKGRRRLDADTAQWRAITRAMTAMKASAANRESA